MTKEVANEMKMKMAAESVINDSFSQKEREKEHTNRVDGVQANTSQAAPFNYLKLSQLTYLVIIYLNILYYNHTY